MKLPSYLFPLILLCRIDFVFSQTCPQYIEVDQRILGEYNQWKIKTLSGKRELVRIDLFDSEKFPDTNDAIGFLRPDYEDSKSNNVQWTLKQIRGHNTLELMCIYADTAISLNRLVDESAIICRGSYNKKKHQYIAGCSKAKGVQD